MADIRGKLSEIYSLEQLSTGRSPVHSLHPAAKLIATLVYMVCIMSLNRYALGRLAPFFFYPVLMMVLAEVPLSMIARRTLPALPFCLFAGLSNLLFDRTVLLRLGAVAVTGGALSLATLVLRTVLCVSAVLILAAVTPFLQLTGELRRMHVPDIFVSLFEMTYRYLGALGEQAATMYTAYRLRSGGKGIAMKDMGSFAGQLLLRSYDRAERVYSAMQCRGGRCEGHGVRRKLTARDWIFLLGVCGTSVLFCLVDVPTMIGGMLS